MPNVALPGSSAANSPRAASRCTADDHSIASTLCKTKWTKAQTMAQANVRFAVHSNPVDLLKKCDFLCQSSLAKPSMPQHVE
jgi:hypothetical protein